MPVDKDCPDTAAIREAADCIQQGNLVIFPTLCLYGLGADALNPEAVSRVFAAKNRSSQNPVSILIPNLDLLPAFAADIPDTAGRIIEYFWPGSITLIFRAAPGLSSGLTAETGTIGIRLPAHPVAAALVAAAKTPITATSANISGEAGSRNVSGIASRVADAAGIILDAGELAAGIGSSILDVTCDPPIILREGAVSLARVQELLPDVILIKK